MVDDTFVAHLDSLAEAYGYDISNLPTVDEILTGIRNVEEGQELSVLYALVNNCVYTIADSYKKVSKPNISTDEKIIHFLGFLKNCPDELEIYAIRLLQITKPRIEVGDTVGKSNEYIELADRYSKFIANNPGLGDSTLLL